MRLFYTFFIVVCHWIVLVTVVRSIHSVMVSDIKQWTMLERRALVDNNSSTQVDSDSMDSSQLSAVTDRSGMD